MGAAYGVEGSLTSAAFCCGSTAAFSAGCGPRHTAPNHCEKTIPAAMATIVSTGHLTR
ncbi:hypothetical protein K2D_03640 [Planctomycetes bacterium K2D]|uniref:Uncharacterized protein n=1 Tax=Botrimarina mediterranea TaxID=2528022 RepID=A0A518K352_9BACT|nr:hypothetical protein Spa11_04110 [Botrimarina mediterranea]QDV76782.1 hypothetical protein K2D_03640 [Planctomycetes bacterium K2D]